MVETYRQYFDEMPCYLTVQDRDLKIVDANRRFVENFGEYEGRYCYQVYKKRAEICEDCPVERTFADGKRHRSEERVRTLDGREVSVIVYTTPIRNEDGEITSVMEMSTNITRIKRLQRQLQESQMKYQQLFEEVPCYISIQDHDLRIVGANRTNRDAFGTFFGCKCYEVYKGRDKACDPCVVLQTFADGEVHVHEEVVTNRHGEKVIVMVTTAPVHNADGEIDSVIEVSADITQIRELQSKLSSVGMVISSISHDLKGLLNGMDGGIYLVDTGLKTENQDRVTRGWEMVQRNVDRIRSTVLDILYYAKDREPDWQEVRAEEIVAEVAEIMRPKAQAQDIAFRVEISPDVSPFAADPSAVRSMLINLIDNSLDACRLDREKEDHEVTLKAESNPEEVIFRLEDNGVGMSQEAREKAFTLFFSSKGSGGTGLGLFIANKIVQAHAGKIEVESELGRGASFRVRFPRERAVPDAEADDQGGSLSQEASS